MSQTWQLSVFKGVSHRILDLLSFRDTAEGAARARESVSRRPDDKIVSKSQVSLTQESDDALRSVLFAIGAYGRYSLTVVAEKLLTAEPDRLKKLLATESDSVLRKELSKRVKRLRKQNPAKLIRLHHYLLEFSQNRIAKAGD